MSVEIVPLTAVGDPRRLEPLVRRVFGDGDRAPGWFRRKLHRECVDPSLSRVAVEGDAQRPEHWRGYVLVGTPPSLGTAARTSGGGVVADARGRGIGRDLFAAAASAAAHGGYARLKVPAEESRAAWFESLGYVRIGAQATVLTRGTASRDDIEFGTPGPWSTAIGEIAWSQWLPEAWDRTDRAARATVRAGVVTAHLCREGRAVVAHRVVAQATATAKDVTRAIDALRTRLRHGTPLLVVGLDPVSSVTARLQARGWSIVQRAVTLERNLSR